ncbi:bifunctional pyr operon transcriptional regulator/uracil phosphoribosyltransferase PyrR [Caballeronia sp. LZ065]|uniref:bifunctional pyr operon transcriptional regulator/uracil phosphoribosyltransferase PyrR n=1 Tax=Caballeronia sp. LZ065 TaxID=3038571 RepID=UPI00285B33C9|nr:bifunctional pyr operon transcriptional regulator/uracil phosphoribosyltransferase PyrR [Caballeronia sp. LZ065]MDR5780178.1 bifunctional pyr operon transcriptional regulator/uracil phosphoribosyltransferase PyrR [Caballeronia sp. LZ065]
MSSIDAEALYRALVEQIRSAVGPSLDAPDGAVLAGIYSGGVWLAERLAQDLKAPHIGVVNVALHRDDYAKKGLHSQARPTELPFDVNGRRIILIDDVLSTGRTVRAAINELYDYGRPASIDLAVLADRGGREMPIAARFTGGMVDVPAGDTLVLARNESNAFTFTTEPRAQ